MKPNYKPWICGAIIALLVGCNSNEQRTNSSPAVPWRSDYPAALAESQRTHKPVLIDFHANWCGPCQQMEKTTWTDKNVATALADYVPVQVDVDQHGDLAQKFHVDGIPNMVLVDEKGSVLKSAVGYHDSDAFLAWLREKSVQ